MTENRPHHPKPGQSEEEPTDAASAPASSMGGSDAETDAGADTDQRRRGSLGDDSISLQNITLMKRVKARDETALEELYDRYSGSVYAIAKHILRHSADAEEVVVDTFWEVWRKADRYDPSRGSVISYLLLLARSRAIDRSRQVRSREIAHGQMQALELNSTLSGDAESDEPGADLALAERRAHVRRLLSELPPERREVIELNFLKGLSHQQIAALLDVPLGTIKTRIRQGLIQLYEQLRITDRGSSL